MKKITFLIFILTSIAIGGTTVHAQTPASCPSGSDNDCPNAQVCNPDTKQCMVDPNDGLYSVGDGPCASNDECRGNTTDCNATTQKCEYSSSAGANAMPDTPSSTASPGTPTGSSASTANTGNFVPLTNLPIFGSGNLTSVPTLPAFFNALYVYCVGIAAVLAVIQLIHAGILYMGGDSVTEVKQARDLIASSVLGLVLVLSPVIVFTIINPKILSLNVGLNQLAPGTTTTTFSNSAVRDISATSAADCQSKGGTVSGDATNIICTVPADSAAATAATACTNFQDPTAMPSDESCIVGAGDSYIPVNNSCCSGIQSGYRCCAKSNTP
jgi:hypothetical protein